MKPGILIWLILNVFESVKSEFRHHQQQQQQERFGKSTNVTAHPWPADDDRVTEVARDGRRYWTVDLTRIVQDEDEDDDEEDDEEEVMEKRGWRRNHTVLSVVSPTAPFLLGNATVTALPTGHRTLTPPRAEAVIAAREIGEDEECIERILDEFLLTDDLVSPEVLSDKNEAQKLANLLAEMSGGKGQMRNLIESTMEKHPRIVSISTSVTKGPEKSKLSQTIYRKGGFFVDEHRKGYPQFATNDRSYWTPLFQDCLTGNWIFGFSYTVSNRNQRQEMKHHTSNVSENRKSPKSPGGLSWSNFIPSDATVYFAADSITGPVDQCLPSLRYMLNGGPKCEAGTTQCVAVPDSGFHIGGYKCTCRPGFYFPDNYTTSQQYFNGSEVERGASSGNLTKFRCLPCPDTCSDSCSLSGVCIVKGNDLLRYIVLSGEISCIFFTLVLSLVVFKHRKCKTIATGMWTILEMILLGSIILYASVLIRSFQPSTKICLLEPWCREIGFVICYGAIILKLYRILIEFRTRKAHRAVVRDKDLLKYLSGMIVVVIGYMAAWTATNLNMIQKEGYSMVTIGLADEGRIEFPACKAVWWDYVTQTGEILILLFGIRLSYASRNATTQFQERCFLSVAIAVEAGVSTVLYILRFFYWDTMHPDISFLAYFIRSQLTTSLALVLVFLPKWWYQQFHINRSRTSRNYLMQESGRGPFEAFKPQDGVTATNSDVEGEISLADMNPEDIRAELKRLYTQLEVLKNKTIRFDNPHISKRRGGRKIAHRRFSLQKKGSREKTLRHQTQRLSAKHADAEVTEAEPSRTPEDSVCSNEGPSIIINDGPSDIVHVTPKKNQK